MVRDTLSEREQLVLSVLVRAHVEVGGPVGSGTLLERESFECSPATIRKTLASLEEKGFVSQPHTSAGRQPTNKGYRLFVEESVNSAPADGPSIGLVRRQLEGALQEVAANHISADEIHVQLAQIIGGLSMQLGLFLAPRFEQGKLQSLELVRLTDRRLLMVVTLTQGPVKGLVIEVGSSVDNEAVVGVCSRLNEKLAGLTMEEIGNTVRERVGDFPGEPELLKVVVDEIESIGVPITERLHVAGARNICVQPEFRDSLQVADVLNLVEHKEMLVDLLSRRHGVVVTIGDENEPAELRLCSLVTASFEVDGATGVLGVMGPTRMDYDQVVALVDYVATRAPDLV
ncbi:MAG: heat-inducible transcriptional repressor HrcA [Candidatus Latescibacterota bacterium]|nr:heat-inducible transcriptional repressor HrcA [Candidatus Latescibacterota bacterium]